MPLTNTQKILAWGSAGLMTTASALGVMFYSPSVLSQNHIEALHQNSIIDVSASLTPQQKAEKKLQQEAEADASNDGLDYDSLNDAKIFARKMGFTPNLANYIYHWHKSDEPQLHHESKKVWEAHSTFDGAVAHHNNSNSGSVPTPSSSDQRDAEKYAKDTYGNQSDYNHQSDAKDFAKSVGFKPDMNKYEREWPAHHRLNPNGENRSEFLAHNIFDGAMSHKKRVNAGNNIVKTFDRTMGAGFSGLTYYSLTSLHGSVVGSAPKLSKNDFHDGSLINDISIDKSPTNINYSGDVVDNARGSLVETYEESPNGYMSNYKKAKLGNKDEGSPAHWHMNLHGQGGLGQYYDEYIGKYHSHIEYDDLIYGVGNKKASDSAIKVVNPQGSNSDGTVKARYPNAAQIYDQKTHRHDPLDVIVSVSDMRPYHPWDSESRMEKFKPADHYPSDLLRDRQPSLVFSRNLYHGFMYNGLTDMKVRYTFLHHDTNTPVNFHDGGHYWVRFRKINGLSPYKSNVTGNRHTDASFNNEVFVQHIWNNLKKGKFTSSTTPNTNWYNDSKYGMADPTSETIESANTRSWQNATNNEYVYNDKSKIRSYRSRIYQDGFTTGGMFNSAYTHKFDHDVFFNLSEGLGAYFHVGSAVGYGNVQPITDMNVKHTKTKVHPHQSDLSGKSTPLIKGIEDSDANDDSTTKSRNNSDKLNITKVDNVTGGILNKPGQSFDYTVSGKVPAWSANNVATQKEHEIDSDIYASDGKGHQYDTGQQHKTGDYWTTTLSDKHSSSDYYKFQDKLPSDVEYYPSDAHVDMQGGAEIPLEYDKGTPAKDGGYYGGRVHFELTPKQMDQYTGGATSAAGTVGSQTHSVDETASDYDKNNGTLPKDAPFKVVMPVRADHLPPVTNRGNDNATNSDSVDNNGTFKPWQSDYHQSDGWSNRAVDSDSNHGAEGWYQFKNGGDSQGSNSTNAEERVYGQVTNEKSNVVPVEIKRLRASIWHYDFNHDGHETNNWFPDNQEIFGGAGNSSHKQGSDSDDPYRFHGNFNSDDGVLKHTYHYGYEGSKFFVRLIHQHKHGHPDWKYRFVYPSEPRSDKSKITSSDEYGSSTGKNHVPIPMNADTSDLSKSYSDGAYTGNSSDAGASDFEQTNYLPYIVPRIDLIPPSDTPSDGPHSDQELGDNAGRVVIDTDKAGHGLPFRVDMRPMNFIYGDNSTSGSDNNQNAYYRDFGGDKVTMNITKGSDSHGPLLYSATRNLITNDDSDGLAHIGHYHNHDTKLDEWPKGNGNSKDKPWSGYDQYSAVYNNTDQPSNSDYYLNTSGLGHGYLPVTISFKIDDPTGAQINATPNDQPIHTHAYITDGNKIVSRDDSNKSDEVSFGYTKKTAYGNTSDISDDAQSNRATFIKPERTVKYARQDMSDSDDARELYEQLSVTQPRTAVGKTGYGISANDLGINYMGHLLAPNYAHTGTNMQFAFPRAFNNYDSNISYSKDNRSNETFSTPYPSTDNNKPDEGLADNLLHVDPHLTSQPGQDDKGLPSDLDSNPSDTNFNNADKEFDGSDSDSFPEHLHSGDFHTTYGFYPRKTINNTGDNSDNGNVALETNISNLDRMFQPFTGSYDNSDPNSSTQYSDASLDGSDESGAGLLTKSVGSSNVNNSHTINEDGQNERMFTPFFMKAGKAKNGFGSSDTYDTWYHKAYGSSDRSHHLGGNFFDIDEDRPIHMLGHQNISKDSSTPDSDEISLQPILTNPQNGLMQTPLSNPAFPSTHGNYGWLSNSLWTPSANNPLQ